MLPDGTKIIDLQCNPKWFLTGAYNLDLARMSTAAGRRDFPQNISGSHLSANESSVCFTEVKIQPDYVGPAYLLQFRASIKAADFRQAGDAGWSGSYYDKDHGFSHQVFEQGSGDLNDAGADGILRYSAPLLKEGQHKDVLGLLPTARDKMQLEAIIPLCDPNTKATVTLLDGRIVPVQEFYPRRLPQGQSTHDMIQDYLSYVEETKTEGSELAEEPKRFDRAVECSKDADEKIEPE